MASLSGLAAAQDPTIGNGTVSGIFNSFFGPDPISLFGVVILTSLGTWGLPQMVGKFYAIKSEGAIHKGTIISTVFAIIVAGGCYFLGGFGRLFSEELGAVAGGNPQGGFDNVIPTMLSSLSPFLLAIVIILVLSASMSTLSSLVLTSSSTVTLDLIKGRISKNMDEKKQLLTMRALIIVFIVISAALAIFQSKTGIAFIAQAMGISWGAMAGAFLAPFLYGLYWKRTTSAGCWASMIFSTVFMTIDMLTNLKVFDLNLGFLQSPINAGAFCMIAGLVLVPLVSLISKAPEKNFVENIFSCYQRKVTVLAKDSIETEEP
jgi:SSS family solute:Na+ symporter